LGYLYHAKGDNDKAMAESERAVALNPSGISALVSYANNLRYAGRPEEAIPILQKAIRLNPLGGSILYREFGTTLQMTGRFEEAVSAYKKAIQLSPNDIQAHLFLAVAYSMMGRGKEARAEAGEVLRLNPKFSVASWEKRARYRDPSEKAKVANAMREAGLK
jgi:adenylate cyclase